MVNIGLPDGASLNRTEAVTHDMVEMIAAHPGVADVVAIPGYSLLKQGVTPNNSASLWCLPWEERPGMGLFMGTIIRELAADDRAGSQRFPFAMQQFRVSAVQVVFITSCLMRWGAHWGTGRILGDFTNNLNQTRISLGPSLRSVRPFRCSMSRLIAIRPK